MANKINAVDVPQIFDAATFDEIRTRLIDWLQNQDEFKDYNFSGSRLSVLIDLLAYNTLYMQQFSNSALYESFFRTAKLRSSVIQHAQDMGYFPSARNASTNTIRITASYTPPESSPISITIPSGTKFTASIEKVNFFDFVTWDDVEIIRGINNKYISDLKLIQGKIIRQEMIYEKNGIILINDNNIDRRYVRLYVDGARWTDWTTKPIVQVTGASTIFYQRETIDGFTEIYFGEGSQSVNASGILTADYVGGLKPAVGSTIVIEYISNDGEESNGCKDFEYIDTIPNVIFEKIEENPSSTLGKADPNYVGASGGGEPEDIERVREMGAVMRETQRRAVTTSDYEALVSFNFGNIVQAIQCYTDSEKPGYAFISIKPLSGLYLTTVQKEDIQNFLRQYNISTITPIVHSPNYLYVKKNVKVTYSINNLSQTEEWLQGQVLNAIDRYYTEEVEIFNKGFYTSKMNGRVDDADISILGTTTSIGLVREIENFYTSPQNGVPFLNSFMEASMYSSDILFESHLPTIEPYYIHYVGTKKNTGTIPGVAGNENTGLTLIGPFADGEISGYDPYEGTDFDKIIIDGRDNYYAVGYVDYLSNTVTYDLNILNQDPAAFSASYIEMHVTPVETNIYTDSGSLIVFENQLRPQYTNIVMEAVAR